MSSALPNECHVLMGEPLDKYFQKSARLAGTALVCASLLMFEILRVRVLGVVGHSELGIYATAFAMLGTGAAASICSLLEADDPVLTNKLTLSARAHSVPDRGRPVLSLPLRV